MMNIRIELDDPKLCNNCPMLSISENQDMIGECRLYYWCDDEMLDIDESEAQGRLTYIRPQRCIDENG